MSLITAAVHIANDYFLQWVLENKMTDVLKKYHFDQQTVTLICDWSNVKRQHPRPFTFSLLPDFSTCQQPYPVAL